MASFSYHYISIHYNIMMASICTYKYCIRPSAMPGLGQWVEQCHLTKVGFHVLSMLQANIYIYLYYFSRNLFSPDLPRSPELSPLSRTFARHSLNLAFVTSIYTPHTAVHGIRRFRLPQKCLVHETTPSVGLLPPTIAIQIDLLSVGGRRLYIRHLLLC